MAAYENQESLPYILEAINDLQEWIWKALRLEIPFLQKKISEIWKILECSIENQDISK